MTTTITPGRPPVSGDTVRPSKYLHDWHEPATPRAAATVLLLRDAPSGLQVLMTRRSATASFAPGAYVFPGGALDESDGSKEAMSLSAVRPGQSPQQRAFSVAAIREAFEELGILLAYRPDGALARQRDLALFDRAQQADFLAQVQAHGFRLAVDQVYWLCHWITDRDLPKRFDARFFVARMPADQEPHADGAEQFEPVWVTPGQALARHEAGQFNMIFPTIRTLRRLARFESVDQVIEQCRGETPQFVSSPRAGFVKGEVERFSEEEMQFGELELVCPDGRVLHSLDWCYDKPVPLTRNVLRLTCPNPGMMTGPGTNTYIVGQAGHWAVIDPGPEDDAHVDRIAAVVGHDLKFILCTHAHPDHSPGARRLSELTKAPILGRPWGPRRRTYGNTPGETDETDPAFVPDRTLEDGERLVIGDSTLRVIHTPGHASNHLCFVLEEDGLLFSGDHINNGSTVVINPPDGNMIEYLQALKRLQTLTVSFILPAHGYVLGFAQQAIEKLIGHRLAREAKVLRSLQIAGSSSVGDLVKRVYDDTHPALHPVAQRSLLAHLEKLQVEGQARMQQDLWTAVPGGTTR
jgi:recombination protein RecT